ncbi:MAG TPA: DUF2934 domain-containing protein [Verrucomicrobiae bacterium]|nr:DUF2934 domain-containing protein [Verrucomicrobiae bacterium]
MAKHMTNSNTPTQEQIARRAYEIFIERGQPEGRDLEHWLEAERQLRAAGQSKNAPVTATSSATSAPIRATQPATATNGRSSGNGRAKSAAAARK